MHRHIHLLTLASLLTACQLDPKDIGTPDSASEATQTSGGSETSAGGVTQGTATDGSDTGDDPIPTATDTGSSASDTLDTDTSAGSASDTLGTDGSASDTLDTDGSASDTLETDGEETEDLLPAECDEVDPATDATFALAIPGWPDDPKTLGLEHDVLCTVDAVGTANATVTTALTCDVEGAPLPATLDLTAAPEGDVAWKIGDGVHLVYRDFNDQDFSQVRALELRRGADDALLVSANDSVIDEQFEGRFAPLTVDLIFACGAPDGPVPQRINFTPIGGDTLSIFHAHRGLLPLAADEGFAIDVEDARADEFHHEGNLKVLLRRVATP